jgi:hypothetical protein
MVMRFRQLCVVLIFCLAASAQTLKLDELMKFLTSSVELKMTDTEVAKYLAKVKLSERLDDVAIEKLLASGIGPKTLNFRPLPTPWSRPRLSTRSATTP